MDCPEIRQVICIPRKTTLYTTENAHTEQHLFWRKALHLKEPSVSKLLKVGSQGPPGHDTGPFLHNPSNVWASNLCFSEKCGHTNYDKQLNA